MGLSGWAQRVFFVNGTLKAIAFGLTLALFIWVREDRESALTGNVPVRLVIPDGMVLVTEPVERVRLTVGGRWTDLNKFDLAQLPPIRVEVAPDAAGSVGISSEQIRLPPGLRVTSIYPNYVQVELEPAATRRVEVRVRRTGEPADSFEVGDIEVTPKLVEVKGPRSSIDKLESVWTEPVDVTDRTETFEQRVQLRIDDRFVQYDVDQPINVRIPITTQEVTRTLQEVSVVGMNTSYAVMVHPDVVSVTVRGPKQLVDKITTDTLYAAVDLTEESRQPPGRFNRPAKIYNMPENVHLVQFHPTSFLVTTSHAPTQQPDGATD